MFPVGIHIPEQWVLLLGGGNSGSGISGYFVGWVLEVLPSAFSFVVAFADVLSVDNGGSDPSPH